MFKFILLLFIPLSSFAQPDIMERTYPRGNAICYLNGKRIEILIRGREKFIEPNDNGYGEYILYQKNGKYKILPISQPDSETYRFMSVDNALCTRVKGFNVGKKMLAMLFLKENGAMGPKLAVQLFDKAKAEPTEVIETDYISNEAESFNGGFAFISHLPKDDVEMGKVQIHGETFSYQDRCLSTWVGYSSKGFETLPALTFMKYPEKTFFKNEAEFLKEAGWDAEKKAFNNRIAYFAVNHQLKKECLLMTSIRKKPDGSEQWRCRQKM